MARPDQPFFLDRHLTAAVAGGPSLPPPPPPPSTVIVAWSDLRRAATTASAAGVDAAIRTLGAFGPSLHVADAHVQLLLSLPPSPALLRLLYLWLRKSRNPSSTPALASLVSAAISASNADAELLSAGVLLLGAIAASPGSPAPQKTACLELLCGVLEKRVEFSNELLAGVGYALSVAKDSYFERVLRGLLRGVGRVLSQDHGLMILHLMEWFVLSSIDTGIHQKVRSVCIEVSKYREMKYAEQVVVMAAAGILRGLNGRVGAELGDIKHLRSLVEGSIASIAMDSAARTDYFNIWKYGVSDDDDKSFGTLIQFLALGLSRCGPCSFHPSLIVCLAVCLMADVFPLPVYNRRAIENLLGVDEVKQHSRSALFRGAGAITSAFCNQYVLADEESKLLVEDRMWSYCRECYLSHRLAKFELRNGMNDLLVELEKIAESAFLMVVLIASVVAKHKASLLLDVSVKILEAFSCFEYFRRVRLPEYSETIRAVVKSIQNETSSVSFVRSMPSYLELTNQEGYGKKYVWAADEVQTARILFYLRVIPTCIEHIPLQIFTNLVVPTMFLYMMHPGGKVSRAAHTVFASFLSSGKEPYDEERLILNEQLIFYYVEKSLEVYPDVTPYEGLAPCIVSSVRHAPAGSPAVIFCIHKLVDKATNLCLEAWGKNPEMWKIWHEDSGPNKKTVDLLLRLIFLVDIQVLPELLKLLAQFVMQLPKYGQTVVLGHLFSQVAESDDVTRKPSLASWLNSVTYLCSSSNREDTETGSSQHKNFNTNILSFNATKSRL